MIKPIPAEEFRRNYIEASPEYERLNMMLADAYKHKQCSVEMTVNLDSLPAYQDVADYLGYKVVPVKGLDEEAFIRHELEIIIRPVKGFMDK